ncbi:P-loop containing nucleoside triphosphate hydrolase protein [Tribonema minus]|uniref:P-loop containing nucleoside triphosphate hydrolase protein n=1 Tax=Tribonema minus TaxID=303371 RepID=A0A835YM87_9STRA|nr:P-loop containing nucleoside triphosphate hydrolase protein [Tribonema minus]
MALVQQAATLVIPLLIQLQLQCDARHLQGQSSLARALMRMFRMQLFVTGVMALVQQAATLVIPLLVQQLLQWYQDPTQPVGRGYMLAAILFCVGCVGNGIIANHLYMKLYNMGMDARTTVNALIYRKSLNLSNRARQTTSTGECVTLMSNDAQRLPDVAFSVHNIWTSPLIVAVTVYLLVNLVGVAALAGLAFLVVMMPLQATIAIHQMGVQRGQMKRTDARLRLVNEVLQGIKIVKYYAWEAPFAERLTALREVELQSIKRFAFASAYSLVLLVATPFVMCAITVTVFFSQGGDFNPATVFTAVSLLLVIRFPLIMLPMTIANYIQAKISLGRLQRFIELEELDEEGRAWTHRQGTGKGRGTISVSDGVFSWTADTDEAADKKRASGMPDATAKPAEGKKQEGQRKGGWLRGGGKKKGAPGAAAVTDGKTGEGEMEQEVVAVAPVVGPGELVAVVGQVGSGKSSLVAAVLGEMTRVRGRVTVDGSVAYVAQTAWIVNATLRENVLMGLPFDAARYDRVVEVCALQQDFAMLPAGDRTEIGEKGINLSGGQKQRVSLARAAYADADVYVFDDPLSAVDAHVARHIFERCIKGELRGKTRLLCANQLQFLADCDRVMVVRGGGIAEAGPYAELVKVPGGELAALMETFGAGAGDSDEEEEEEEAGGSAAQGLARPQREGGKDAAAAAAAARADIGIKLIEDEGKEAGAVNWRVYRTYFRDGSGGWALPIWLVVVTLATQGATSVFEYWLSVWTNAYIDARGGTVDVLYQSVYIALVVLVVALYFVRGISIAIQAVRASRVLHGKLVGGIMRAPMVFFDTTPVGRILNRFSKDMDAIDLLLPRNVPLFIMTLSTLIGVFATIIAVLPWFALFVAPLLFTYYHVQKYYRPVSRDLQRLESLSRSPIFAQFSETLTGVATLRAYGRQEAFLRTNAARLDQSNRAYYHLQACNRWLQAWLELLGNFTIFTAAMLIAIGRDNAVIGLTAGTAGLILTYTQQVTGTLNMVVRMGCETEARITSAERVTEYGSLTPEAPPINADYRPPEGWPAKGAITFRGVSLRYRPDLDLVLNNVTFEVRGGEKIGIAGRTGSGKSSLMTALFRIVEPCAGSIEIDGVDALRVGLDDLRNALSIIPQDPVMFQGTLRQNLDPFGTYDDARLWAALRAAHLSDYVTGLDGKLDAEVAEGGENMSVGQRQLVCLARAILRRAKILVCDEATANIDIDTDILIQKTIREEFAACTVLTIAHRLNTIMDSDKILVMQDGRVGEFDTPAALVARSTSLLMGFISQTGKSSSRRLVEIANNSSLRLSKGDLMDDITAATIAEGDEEAAAAALDAVVIAEGDEEVAAAAALGAVVIGDGETKYDDLVEQQP